MTDFPQIFFMQQDLFLKQHVEFKTKFREGNELSMLDLIFTNEDYMIENLTSIAPLGKVIILDWCGHSLHTRL